MMNSLFRTLYVGTLLSLFCCSPQEDEVKIVSQDVARVGYIDGSPTTSDKRPEIYTARVAFGNLTNRKALPRYAQSEVKVQSILMRIKAAIIRIRFNLSPVVFVDKDVTLEKNNYYTAVIANTDPVNIDTTATLGVFLTHDDMTLPATGNANIRFVNVALADGGAPVDFYVYRTASVPVPLTPFYTNTGYLQGSGGNTFVIKANDVSEMVPWGFDAIPVPLNMTTNLPEAVKYTVEVRPAGALSTAPTISSKTVSLIAGRFYTIVYIGIQANGGNTTPAAGSQKRPLFISVIEHFMPNL